MRDVGYTDTTPFFSPSLMRHCKGRSCTFGGWGTSAQVSTPFTSSILYFNRYTDCGNGVLEHTLVIHK